TLVLLTNPAWDGVAVDTTETGVRSLLSYPEFERLRAHNGVFSGMIAIQSQVSELDIRTNRHTGDQPAKARCQMVSGEFFSVLGLQPALGRVFMPEEDKLSADPVAVLSYEYWQREFAGGAAVAGQAVHVSRTLLQIVGGA